MVSFKQKIIFLVFSIFVIALVSSAPPSQTNVNVETGLQIFFPDYSVIAQNQGFNLNIHVSNVTDGKTVNSLLINCTLDLYNSTGYEVFEGNLTPVGSTGDYNLFISGSNFTDLGFHAWRIYCENNVGGTASGIFEVTLTGENLTIEKVYIIIFLMFVYIGLFLLSVYSYGRLPKENNKNEEGRIIKISYLKYFSIFVGGLVYLFGFLILNLAGSLGIAYLPTEFGGQILFNLSLIIGYLAIPIVLIVIYRLIENIFQDREIKKFMERGIDYD